MIRSLFYLLLIFAVSPLATQAQATVNYDDVGVIVNKKSALSMKVGAYFMTKRSIPAQNLIIFDGDTAQEIDSTSFEAIRKQIEDSLTAKNLVSKLNYLVTTRGVPLRVSRGKACEIPLAVFIANPLSLNEVRCSSFDADLMLILGKYKNHIAKGDILIPPTPDVQVQPYCGESQHFTRAKYDIYLVTRLTAYSEQNIYSMIDRSGPNTLVNRDSALFVIDAEYTNAKVGVDTALNNQAKRAGLLLKSRGWKVLLDSSDNFIRNQRNVLGYVSWGSNDDTGFTVKGKANCKFYGASLAETYVSRAGRTYSNPPTYGQSLLADLIKDGCTGAVGCIYEPYTFSFTNVQTLFERYTDTTQATRYNLAESYFMSNPTMSWMTTVIGDPKTSIITHISTVGIEKREWIASKVSIYPNPRTEALY